MKEIQLTQGQVALVDDEDFERVSQYKWCARLVRNYANGGAFIASRGVRVANSVRTVVLHRFIMLAQKGQIVDHIDGDTLNNQRINLRFATQSQNSANTRGLRKRNTSGFQGVFWKKQNKKWAAQIGGGAANEDTSDISLTRLKRQKRTMKPRKGITESLQR